MTTVYIKKRGYAVIILASSLISYYIVSDRSKSLFGIAMFLYALCIFLYVYVEGEKNLVLGSLEIRRHLEELEDDRPSKVSLEIVNKNIYPLMFFVRDTVPERFRIEKGTEGLLLIGGKKRVSLTYTVIPSPGHNVFGSVRIVIRDPLNLFETEILRNDIKESEVFIVPRPKYLSEIRKSWEKSIGAFSERRKGGRGTTFLYVREYLEGDELRHIDWKATARTGKLLVKIFESESQVSSVIFFINDKSLRRGKYSKAFDTALRLLASLVVNTYNNLLSKVRLIVLEGNNMNVYTAVSGSESSKLLFKALASQDISEHDIDPNFLYKVLLVQGKRSSISIVTSNIKVLEFLRKSKVKTKMYYVDPDVHDLKEEPKDLMEKVKDLKAYFRKAGHELYLVTPLRII